MTDIVELFNACLYIQDNLDADLSLLLLARTVGLSRFRFHRIFKAWRGETLHDFVTRMRMERAAFELRYPVPRSRQRSIKAIAVGSGYKSLSSFSHAFSAYAHLSPREFRNRALQQKPPTPVAAAAVREPTFFGRYAIRVERVPAREITVLDPSSLPNEGRRLASLAEVAAACPFDGDRYGIELLPDLLARTSGGGGAAGRTGRLNCLGVIRPAGDATGGTTVRLAAGRYAVIEGHGSLTTLYRAWRRGFEAWLALNGECPKPDRIYLRFSREATSGMKPIALFVPLEDLAAQGARD